jgi:hypothetical protein
MQNKFEVEIYWDRIRSHTKDPRDWSMLNPNEQIAIIDSINLLLLVLQNNPNK